MFMQSCDSLILRVIRTSSASLSIDEKTWKWWYSMAYTDTSLVQTEREFTAAEADKTK